MIPTCKKHPITARRGLRWAQDSLPLRSVFRARVSARPSIDSGVCTSLIPAGTHCVDLQVTEQDSSACFMSVAMHIGHSHVPISIQSMQEAEVSASVSAGEDPGDLLVSENFSEELVFTVHGCFAETSAVILRMDPVCTADNVSLTGRDICVSIQMFRL